MKRCKKCGGNRLNAKADCKDCKAAYMREWIARNHEKVKAAKRKLYAANPERAKAERKRKKESGQKQEENRRYRKRHPEKIRAVQRACEAKKPEHYKAMKRAKYLRNREKLLAQCKLARERRMAADPEGERRKRAEYMARRRREKPQCLIYGRMSALVRQHLKKSGRNPSSKAGRQWPTLTGYTLDQLIERLKGTIPDGWTWDDYLSGELEVDHIIPDKDFKYCSVDDPDFRTCWALTNLRLLPKEENNKRRFERIRP